ncbi:MAG: hypothetical protein ACO22M_00500 [Candidatus Nanopelagicaceae bacterium]
MNDKTMWKFTRINQEDGIQNDLAVMLSSDVPWTEVLEHFAAFLDGCAFEGVYRILEKKGVFDK